MVLNIDFQEELRNIFLLKDEVVYFFRNIFYLIYFLVMLGCINFCLEEYDKKKLKIGKLI